MGLERFLVSKSYDFGDVQLTIGGQRIGGFAEDGSVNIEFPSEIASVKVGADGEAVVSRLPLSHGEVTITLMETSVSNAVLQALLAAQRLAPAGFVLPFAMFDPTTGESVLAGQCVFSNQPAINKGREAGTREWKLLIPRPLAVYATE